MNMNHIDLTKLTPEELQKEYNYFFTCFKNHIFNNDYSFLCASYFDGYEKATAKPKLSEQELGKLIFEIYMEIVNLNWEECHCNTPKPFIWDNELHWILMDAVCIILLKQQGFKTCKALAEQMWSYPMKINRLDRHFGLWRL